MKTFEQQFKVKFKEMLSNFIENEIVVSNDINYDPLVLNPDAVVAIITTGLGQTSSRNDYDLINTSFVVSFIVDANNLQKLLGSLTSLVWNFNGKWDNLTIPIWNLATKKLEDKTYIFKPIFTTPAPFGGTSKLQTRTKTIDVAMASFQITVGYSSNADIRPDKFDLEIDGIKYLINAIRYNIDSAPVYDSTLINGTDFAEHTFLSHNIIYTFTIMKSLKGIDPLQDLFESELFAHESYLVNKNIRLHRYSPNMFVSIQTFTLRYAYENGSKILILTLTR